MLRRYFLTAMALVLAFFLSDGPAQAEPTPEAEDSSFKASLLHRAKGMVVLDYTQTRLTTGEPFDLLGVHYLHQANEWLYIGVGLAGPIAQGNYGGFIAIDTALHAQKRLAGNWFVQAGLGLGTGAGGDSILGIKDLSGTGTYLKTYAGVGYQTPSLSYGVNLTRIKIKNSAIDDVGLGLFLQKPLGFPIGSYADTGRLLSAEDFGQARRENLIGLEIGHLDQIDPQGSYKGDIGLFSLQYSHFLDARNYAFLGIDVGTSGLVWYNQAQAGIGRRVALSPHLDLYGQLGIGTGGWVTDAIDTGPGLVLFPKARLEYHWDNGATAYLSAGYLAAPLGTSRNWSLGAGLTYHISGRRLDAPARPIGATQALRGVRTTIMLRRYADVAFVGKEINDLTLQTFQMDYLLGRNWYIPIQISSAVNDFSGFAGYVEGAAGLGWQSRPFAKGRMQAYAQLLYGLNDLGISAEFDAGPQINASLGASYQLTDALALYGQVSQTSSLNRYLDPDSSKTFRANSIGFGVTYRFSLPGRGHR